MQQMTTSSTWRRVTVAPLRGDKHAFLHELSGCVASLTSPSARIQLLVGDILVVGESMLQVVRSVLVAPTVVGLGGVLLGLRLAGCLVGCGGRR
jgi:hypothetical protein